MTGPEKGAVDSRALKATLLLVSTLTVMAGATIAPSLPSMQAHFRDVANADLWVRLVLTIPALLIALTAPVAGLVIDRWGRRRLLLAAMGAYAAAGSAGLYLDSLLSIVVSRAFLGLAVAAVMTTVTALIADYYSGAARARFMGSQAAFMGMGGMVFLLAGGALADVSWRLPFLIYLLPLGLLPLAASRLIEPERRSETPVLLAGGLRAPGSHLRLLGHLYVAAFLGMAGFYLIPVQLPFYLEEVLAGSPSGTGVAIGVSTLFSSVASFLYARVRERVGHVWIITGTFWSMGVGLVLVSSASTYLHVLLAMLFCGAAMGLLMPNLNVWLSQDIPSSFRGRALGGLTAAIFLGQFLSPVLSQPLIRRVGLADVFRYAGIALLLVGIVLFVTGRRTRVASGDRRAVGS